MLSREKVRYIRELVAPKISPVLSLYLDVNPAKPENAGKAYVLRAKDAMKSLSVPEAVVKGVLERIKHDAPQAKTRVLFAAGDWIRVYDLQLELPMVEGLEAHYGEPYLTPILYALDESERYGVVFIDQEKWRFFEIYLGEIEELTGAFRAVNPDEWRRLSQDGLGRRYNQGVSRAGADMDRYQRRMEAWSYRFFKHMAEQLEANVERHGIHKVVLMGPKTDIDTFVPLLPKSLRERIATMLSSLPTPLSSQGEVLKLVENALLLAEREREKKLLGELAEKGISGLDQVLAALQEGKLHLLVAPWKLDQKVYRSPDGYVSAALEPAQLRSGGTTPEEVLLKHVLPELAAAFATRIEFVQGEAADRLQKDFGGLAGLTRW